MTQQQEMLLPRVDSGLTGGGRRLTSQGPLHTPGRPPHARLPPRRPGEHVSAPLSKISARISPWILLSPLMPKPVAFALPRSLPPPGTVAPQEPAPRRESMTRFLLESLSEEDAAGPSASDP